MIAVLVEIHVLVIAISEEVPLIAVHQVEYFGGEHQVPAGFQLLGLEPFRALALADDELCELLLVEVALEPIELPVEVCPAVTRNGETREAEEGVVPESGVIGYPPAGMSEFVQIQVAYPSRSSTSKEATSMRLRA
jgi:hypothetical protein